VIDSQQNQLEQLVAENTLLKQRVDQMQRLTALGELVSTTTHEFNNVLMTILNYAKMGMRHRDDATRDKALDKIYTAAERANKITNSVLGMARNRSNQFETTDMVKLIEQTMVLLERELNKYRISVELQIEEVPQIQAIGNQLQQVLLNLLINARQAMPDGGQLIIRLYADDQFVNLAVRDFGTGIPRDKLKKIFQPYFSTKDGPDESGKGGTGLGLASCKNIIEAHSGKIRVESMVGKGTCFTLKLPTGQKQPSALVAANGLSAAVQPMNASTAD
jgi:signal transduction histidine kinase